MCDLTYFDVNCSSDCNTPRHTATHTTHCNTLQHAAPRCNTLQHAVTCCTTLQHIATHCNTLQHTATHCNTLQQPGQVSMDKFECHTTVFTPCCLLLSCNDTVQHATTRRNTLQYSSARYTTLQHVCCLLSCNQTLQHALPLCSTLQHNVLPVAKL